MPLGIQHDRETDSSDGPICASKNLSTHEQISDFEDCRHSEETNTSGRKISTHLNYSPEVTEQQTQCKSKFNIKYSEDGRADIQEANNFKTTFHGSGHKDFDSEEHNKSNQKEPERKKSNKKRGQGQKCYKKELPDVSQY